MLLTFFNLVSSKRSFYNMWIWLSSAIANQWAGEAVVLPNAYIITIIVIYKDSYVLNLNVFKNSRNKNMSNKNALNYFNDQLH